MEEPPWACLPCSATNSIAVKKKAMAELKFMIGESVTMNVKLFKRG